jgi:pimeloyl-ACP methyl ester carboxylesterase
MTTTTMQHLPDWLDRTAYPFEHHWAELEQGRMHFVAQGDGEKVLFVHGTPTWSFEWRHLIRDLSRRRAGSARDGVVGAAGGFRLHAGSARWSTE